MIFRIVLSIFVITATACAAEDKKQNSDWVVKCKPIEEALADIAKAHQYNLGAIEIIFKKSDEYPKCQDGFYGEGISDIVVKSLSSDFSSVIIASTSNKSLNQFVTKHIDSTTDWNDLDQITSLAKSKCPPKGKEVCARIGNLSAKASKEAKKAGK